MEKRNNANWLNSKFARIKKISPYFLIPVIFLTIFFILFVSAFSGINPADGVKTIEITGAEHLDENRVFIENVYDKVNSKDGVLQNINSGNYLRVTFEKNLTSSRDITIYARKGTSLDASTLPSSIEVYEKNENKILATFSNVAEDREYKIYLINLNGNQNVFDLKVLGNVEFDYVVDPIYDSNLTVTYRGESCLAGETDILHISDYDGGHAELPSASNFSIRLCVKDSSGLNTLTNSSGYTWLSLFEGSDSHAEKPGAGTAILNVSIGSSTDSINCSYTATSGSCSANQVCIATISDSINAHIGNCSSFSSTICCGFNNVINLISPANGTYLTSAKATGGNITYDGLYTIHTFYSNGTFNVTGGSLNAEVLVVAGGGGGGSYGGGGAGGLIYNSLFSISGINNVMVGVGGLGHANSNPYNGGNSSFGSINAVGGGAGGGYWGGGGVNGVNGGSGGGGGNVQGGGALGGAGINGQGYAGGTQGSGTDWPGAGGGGASEVGHNGTQTFGGAGGNGTYFSQFTYAGSPAGWFAGGGGGGEYYNTPGVGGAGGGGHGGQGINMTLLTAGINGTGGGGGGAGNGWETGASGGSGIVIVRYLTETSTQSINFTANLTDNLGIQNATIHIYNSTGLYNLTTMNYSAGVTQTTLGIVITLVDNVYTWFVNLFDWGGNQYTAVNNTVTIDTTFPLIDYGAGTLANGVNVSQSNVYVNVSVTETNEANVTFRLFNSTSQITNPVLGATGGNITYSGGYTIHTFYSNGTFNVTGGSLNAEVLVVAGGGGGGNGYYIGGGGGAGGLIYNSSYIVSGSNSVIVGTGGAGGIAQTTPAYSGGNSTFASLTAIGGGRSSSYGFGDDYQNGANGGSGGGSFYLPSTPGNGTVGQGNAGGQGVNGGNVGSGGGGGAGGVGGDGTTSNGGDGGVGLEYPQFATIGGSPTGWFAGGGGGAIYNTGAEYAGAGGLGGGGAGSNGDATNGTANTGGGGGGAERGGTATGGSGGSGIVIVRYLTPTVSAAGTRAINWTGLSDGDYAYNVTVTDLAGNSNTTATRTITLDTHAPNATLISPTNGTYANSSSQNFTANLSDNLGIQNATIYIYNSTGLYNATTTNYAADVTTTTLGIVVTLVDNVYTWFVNLFDWAGNPFTTANNTLAIDTAYPQINFTNPTPSNGTAQNVKSIFVNMTTSDTNSISSFVNFDNSLVSWWRLEQGNGTFFADELGRNNGTRTAFAPTFTSLGKFGGAYSFDAVNNFIDVGTAASLNFANSSAYTFSSWIKISGVGSDGVGNAILGKRNSSGAGYTFYVYNDSRGLYFQSDSTNITSNSQLNFNTWYHVAYTRNSSNQYLFVNGNEVVSGISPTLSTSAATFYIGASAIIPPTNLFNGKIDEVLAFNRSLSLGEIKSLYNANANQYQNNFTNLGDGTHTFKGYVIDAGGFKNSTGTRNVTVDTINPTINFTSPTDTSGSYFSRTNVVINVTASDVNFVNITIKVYNSTSLVNSLTSPNFDNFVNLSGLTTNGIYFFNATATDRAGNVNHTETRNITLDTTRPLVDYGTGTAPDKSNLSQSNIYVNVSVTETNEANVTFRLFNSTSQITNPVLGATGGNITYDGLYTIHTFLSNGTFNVTGGSLNAEVLVVAGGGGGGGGRHSTGGGAGGLIYTTGLTVSGINNIIVGDGGSGGDVNAYGSNGLNSTAFSNTSIGGGGGAGPIAPWVGRNGGSGGGSCLYTSVGGVGVVGQGYDGGRGTADTGPNYGQGGGGGAGAVGAVGTGTTGGDGGDGLNYTINGFNIYYAGGGGAGTYSGGTAGIGGNGGGGNGGTGSEVETINGGAGTDGLGGGGGGGNGGDTITAGIGGNGGSGIVIVRYLTPTSTRAINWTGLADGDYTYNVTVTDLAGNSNTTATITITLDTHAPNATLISPANGTYTNNTSQNFTANLSDNLGIQNATLFVYNSTGLFNSTIINYAADVTTTTLGIIVTLVDNVYTWFYQLFDWAGNQLTTANNTVTIDTINPGINVIYPQNITYNVIITAINYTLSDLYPNTCWFYNGTANNTIACGTNITTKLYSNQGNNTWIVYANDSAGNINSSSLTFFVDTINPTINFTSPTEQNGAYLSKNSILVNVTANDTNLVNITIDISNSTTLINSTTTLSSPNYQNISVPRDGIYYINATTYDSALNKNSTETRIVTLDTTKPLVNYGTGTLASGVNVSQSNVYADIIVTEINEANVTFRLFNSTSQVNVTTLAAGTRNINWTSLSDKTYSYNITITDLAGNSNTTATRTITLDTHAPNATLISPTNGTYLNVSNQNFTANLSDNLGIQNSTLYIYNSTGLYNATTTNYAADVTTTTLGIVVNLLDNVYTWFVNLFDWAGNNVQTGNRTIIVDTAYPIVSFGTGTESNGISSAKNNIYINVSVIETNEANITFNLYNSTSLINRTTFTTPVRTINFTNLSSSGVYSYNVTVTDLVGNENSTETRTITLAFIPPRITNVIYSPNSTDDIDPGTDITFNATISTDDFISISTVILEYYNGTGWTNRTMVNAGGNVYQANITLIGSETNYTYSIFANDSVGNTRQTTDSTLESAWDCSWYVSPTTLGATSGFSEKKNLGTITINNTGDAQFATNNCTLDFRLTYDLDEYRIYFDNSNIKPSNTYTVLAKESSSININATFLTEIKSELVTITANELYSRSNRNSMNVSASIVTVRGDQAYLFTSIVSAPTFVLLKAQDFTLSAYIRNLAGDGSLAKSAYDVDFNWTMPSGFIVKEGDVSVNYPIMLDNSADYNDINIVFNSTNLPLMSPGAYMLYVYGKGKNSSGGDIIMLNNNSLVTESREIILVCSNASDGICVSSCGYLLDSDCSAPSPSVISGSGGGGGGGGSATVKIEKSEATFELVRGKEQSFQFPIKNKYPTEMKNITISVTGLNAEYISIEPKTIDSLLGGASKNISVTIRAPAYFTGRTYNLTFEINSLLILNNTSSRILEKKLVILHILEIPRLETDTLLNSSLEMINKMNSSGMFMKNVNLLLDQLKNQYRGVDFFGVKSSYQKIKLIYDNAFESKSIIEELNLKIAEAENNGISATETKKMLYIGETAYARGDYALALERLKEAKLTYAAEVKGEFNLAYYIKNNPSNVLGIILAFVILSLITIFAVRFVIYKKKLKMLKEEEILLLELMKVIQRECFEKGRMSMGEYEAAMNQYERKLSMVIEDGIRIETKLSNMFKIRAKRDALSEEKKKLILLVKKLQDEYLNKNKIETRVYENMLKSYTTKLSEVQEKIAFIDAGDALKKQKFLRRMFRI